MIWFASFTISRSPPIGPKVGSTVACNDAATVAARASVTGSARGTPVPTPDISRIALGCVAQSRGMVTALPPACSRVHRVMDEAFFLSPKRKSFFLRATYGWLSYALPKKPPNEVARAVLGRN
jgi:hypothetical protein